MFASLLVANRGEIAVRVIRACQELGVRTIAVYSDADADALHVRRADQCFRIGPAPALDSYLEIDALIEAARTAGAEAVHPGYGMLSENPDFARATRAAGLVFVGPPAEVIAAMGDKVAARDAARACRIPVLPGTLDVSGALGGVGDLAQQIGYPVAVKAVAGGGGRGIRVAHDASTLGDALEAAMREAAAAFGRSEIFLERFLERPRHVEVQIIADAHGNVVHLGDRDCSVQRRHQKLIEEAPAPDLPAALRDELRTCAVKLARNIGYVGAGTVEFLVDVAGEAFYFLEMNTRLQVEHGVTELVTGLDLVQLQLRVAAGERLGITQRQVRLRGAAIQARIAAEDPSRGFVPCTGKLSVLELPGGPGVRCDFGVERGDAIPREYDSMFGKVLTWGGDREIARCRLMRALRELRVEGVTTTARYLREILSQPEFVAVTHHTGAMQTLWSFDSQPECGVTTVADDQTDTRLVQIATDCGQLNVKILRRRQGDGGSTIATSQPRRPSRGSSVGLSSHPQSPMDGSVVRVPIRIGDEVSIGDEIVTLEAMKMELAVRATYSGRVEELFVEVGDSVSTGTRLCTVVPSGRGEEDEAG